MCRLLPNPRSKVHQIKYVDLDPSSEEGDERLAVSTEDGRIIFFSTKKLREAENSTEPSIPYGEAVAQLGGEKSGLHGRVKDFEILNVKDEPATGGKDAFLIVTGGSDGTVHLWRINGKDLKVNQKENTSSKSGPAMGTPQVGKLLNSYETGNRITCLKAFVMLPTEDPSGLDESLSQDESDES